MDLKSANNYPGYQDSPRGCIPDGWEVITFKPRSLNPLCGTINSSSRADPLRNIPPVMRFVLRVLKTEFYREQVEDFGKNAGEIQVVTPKSLSEIDTLIKLIDQQADKAREDKRALEEIKFSSAAVDSQIERAQAGIDEYLNQVTDCLLSGRLRVDDAGKAETKKLIKAFGLLDMSQVQHQEQEFGMRL